MVCDRHPRAEWDSVLICLTCYKEQDALMREAAAWLREHAHARLRFARASQAADLADRLEGKA